MEGHESTVWQISFDKTGDFLCSCSEDNVWSVWHITGESYVNKGFVPGLHARSIYSISWSGNDMLATGSGDNKICLLELSRDSLADTAEKAVAFNQLASISAHANDINCVEFSPCDPLVLASCSDDHTVKLWTIK